MGPLVCMVTNGFRGGAADSLLIERVRAASRAGVHLVQVRERGLEGAALLDLVGRAVEAVRGTLTRVLVNDRLDVALAAGAHGVHLRGDSMAASRVRAVAPRGFLVGRSVHGVEEAGRVAGDGGLDYLIFGPVFETASKPGVAAAGVAALAAVAACTTLPVLAIGGMSAERLPSVARSGAAGWAAIGLFAEGSPEGLHQRLRQMTGAFA